MYLRIGYLAGSVRLCLVWLLMFVSSLVQFSRCEELSTAGHIKVAQTYSTMFACTLSASYIICVYLISLPTIQPASLRPTKSVLVMIMYVAWACEEMVFRSKKVSK
jgi:hypothetical protein